MWVYGLNFRDRYWFLVEKCIETYYSGYALSPYEIALDFRFKLFPDGESDEISPFYKLEPYDIASAALGRNPYFNKGSSSLDKIRYDDECRKNWRFGVYTSDWYSIILEAEAEIYPIEDCLKEYDRDNANVEFDNLMVTDYSKIDTGLLRRVNGSV